VHVDRREVEKRLAESVRDELAQRIAPAIDGRDELARLHHRRGLARLRMREGD
jgi:hypothetical protein